MKLYFGLLVLIAVVLHSCGQPKAKEQSGGDLEVPQPNVTAENGFFLTDDSYQKTFAGQMVVWNLEELDSQSFIPVMAVAKEATTAYVKRLGFIGERILKPYGIEFLQNAGKLQALKQQIKQLSRGSIQAKADQLIAAKTKDFSDENKKALLHYCEAKIWQRALNPALIELEFELRPTPAVFCESLYAKEGLLQSQTLCAANPQGQSYFECLWFDGLLKTDLFKHRYGNNEDAKNLLTNPTVVARIRKGIQNFNPSNRSILSQRDIVLPEGPGGEEIWISAGEKRPRLPKYDQLTVEAIIDEIESGSIKLEELQDPAENALELHKLLIAFQELEQGTWLGESMLNLPFAKGAPADLSKLNDGVQERAAMLAPSIFQKVSFPELEKDAGQAAAKIQELAAALQPLIPLAVEPSDLAACLQSTEPTPGCYVAQTQLKAAKVVSQPHVSKAILPSVIVNLRKEQVGDDKLLVMELRFSRNSHHAVTGCYNLTQAKQVGCTHLDRQVGEAYLFDRFEIDQETGLIKTTLVVKNPEAYDLNWGRARSERELLAGFNELSVEDLAFKTFSFTFEPANLHKVIDRLSGGVQVADDKGDEESSRRANLNLLEQNTEIEQAFKKVVEVMAALKN